MPYNEIPVGGSYCVAKGSTNPTVTVGGMFFWEADGECVAPPATATGEACCEVFMWQPNSDGFYYENCSMKCATLLTISVSEQLCLLASAAEYVLWSEFYVVSCVCLAASSVRDLLGRTPLCRDHRPLCLPCWQHACNEASHLAGSICCRHALVFYCLSLQGWHES